MGIVKEDKALGDEVRGPAEGADSGEPGERLDEVCVERRFCFEVEETDLSRCSEVELLDHCVSGMLALGVESSDVWSKKCLPQTTRRTGGSVRAK